jgi:hypothetical protein
MNEYAQWVRANPSSARSIESLARTAVFILSDVRSLLQFQAALAVTNVMALANTEILSPAPSKGVGSDVARLVHHVLCEFQTVFELLARQRLFHAKPWIANRIVVAIEAVKSLLIIISKWRNVTTTFRRAADTLTAKKPADESFSSLSPNESNTLARPSRVRVPDVSLSYVDPETGAVVAPTFTSWREWLRLVLDVLYLVRPVAYAAMTLRLRPFGPAPKAVLVGGGSAAANVTAMSTRRHAWRAWLVSFIFEALLFLGTMAADYKAPLVVTDRAGTPTSPFDPDEDVAAAREEPPVVPERLRSLGMYLLRNPFFERYLRGAVERWVVRGWVARNVPLIGSIVAFQTKTALELQRGAFLYTAGGVHAPAATTTFRD